MDPNPYSSSDRFSNVEAGRAAKLNLGVIIRSALWRVLGPTVLGGTTFAVVAAAVEKYSNLGESTLPAAAFSGLLFGSLATGLLWLFQLRKQGILGSFNFSDYCGALGIALAISPLAAVVSFTFLGLLEEFVNSIELVFEEVASALFIVLVASLFFGLILSVIEVWLCWLLMRRDNWNPK